MEEYEEKVGERGKSHRGWWDEQCVEKKKEVRRELRRWRREGGEGEEYRKMRKEYKELCEGKKKEERERLIREIGEARTESKMWEIVNRERRRRKVINEEIQMGEWKEHFMGLLGGVEERVMKGQEEIGRKGYRMGRSEKGNKGVKIE